MNVFRLENEPADLRNAYGEEFGQRCLLSRIQHDSAPRL